MKNILVFMSALAVFFMVPGLGQAQTAFNLFEAIHDGHVAGLNSNVELWRYYGDGTRIPSRIETPCGTVTPKASINSGTSGRVYWGTEGTDIHTFTIAYDPVFRELAFTVEAGAIKKNLSAESPVEDEVTFCSDPIYTAFSGGLVGNVNNLLMVIHASAGNAVDSCGSRYMGCKSQVVWHSKTEVSNLFLDGVPIEGFLVEADLDENLASDDFSNELKMNVAVPDDQPWTLTGELTVTFEAEDMAFSPGQWRVGLAAYGQYAETTDSDGDGLADEEDACPNSVMSDTVSIDDCDSGVKNIWFGIGCTISDVVVQCAAEAANHGQFVNCVSVLTDFIKEQALITGREKGNIERCAARANMP
jgi:hypothetical protein